MFRGHLSASLPARKSFTFPSLSPAQIVHTNRPNYGSYSGSSLHICIYWIGGSPISCGLARPRSLVRGKLTQLAASHGPGIEP